MPHFALVPSSRKNKKWMVIWMGGPNIHFGDSRYEDYTSHKDDDRKKKYLSRTASQPHNDYKKPAFWARHLLWNKTTIVASIADVNARWPAVQVERG